MSGAGYPVGEARSSGWLPVGEGHELYWEEAGNPDGVPALILHGGPGSGFSETMRRVFDPAKYRIIGFDQRNAKRSRPSAAESCPANCWYSGWACSGRASLLKEGRMPFWVLACKVNWLITKARGLRPEA